MCSSFKRLDPNLIAKSDDRIIIIIIIAVFLVIFTDDGSSVQDGWCYPPQPLDIEIESPEELPPPPPSPPPKRIQSLKPVSFTCDIHMCIYMYVEVDSLFLVTNSRNEGLVNI